MRKVPASSPSTYSVLIGYGHSSELGRIIPNTSIAMGSFTLQLANSLQLLAGMWSRSRGLGLETVSRTNNVSSRSRAISCRWSRRFVRRARTVAQYSRRRPIQTNLPQSVTNSCLFDSGRCTYYLFRLLTYHEDKLADVHSPPVHPTKVAAKKNIITNHYDASNMLQLFLFLRKRLWINMLHLVTDPFPFSNLDFISKILERLFLARIQSHITS